MTTDTRAAADDGSPLLPGQYRAVVAAAMDAIVIIDADGLVLEWNAAAEDLFGYPARDVVGGELAELIVPPGLREQHRRGLARAVAGAPPVFIGRHVEVSGVRANGSQVPIELTLTRVGIDELGRPVFSGFLRDITERQQLTHDLQASRARVVSVSDEARRRVERDLHDGAQQQLVAVAIELGQAGALIDRDPGQAAAALDLARGHLNDAITELRELARGIHPAALTERGLAAAVRDLGRRSPIPVDLDVALTARADPAVETAVYFVAAEALTNASKHGATRAEILIGDDGNGTSVVCEISDNGPGGADMSRGSGLLGLSDRVAAVGGQLSVEDAPGGGTRLSTRIPAHPAPPD